MKKYIAFLMVVVLLFSSFPAAYAGKSQTPISNAGFATKRGSTTTQKRSFTPNTRRSDLEALYDEFQRFWFVKDSDDLQDRFEEYLKSKNIDPDDIDEYDAFMETWVDHYDEDLDFDDLYDEYEFGSDDIDGADEYDILLDDDIDDLYDDYLDDYIDEEYYEDYGEYFDEVYYD